MQRSGAAGRALIPDRARRALAVLFVVPLLVATAACVTRVESGGRKNTQFDPRYLAKTEIDRVIDSNRAEVVAALRRLTEKLYRRNPVEWQKGGQRGLEQAVERVFSKRDAFPELEGRREGEAALYAFSANYPGDRVLALMVGLNSMVNSAFENKDDFYVLDDLDEQKLYNCARNIEIAVWKLGSTRNAGGVPVLLSNELDTQRPNLSFEREFGRIIGLLDFMSRIVADKNGRAVTRVTQSVATMMFLPVGALGIK